MAQEHERRVVEEPGVDPVALSLAGGFVGTVTGLKKGGVGGAVVGGLVGGTTGYVLGAAAEGSDPVRPDADTGPVSVSIDEGDGAEGDDPDSETERDDSGGFEGSDDG
jgi:hypothetical protein